MDIVYIPRLGAFYKKPGIVPVIEDLFELKSFNVRNKVVLDIGAYTGDSAILFVRQDAVKVYALEPVYDFYELMLKNIALNRLEHKIIPRNVGVACESGNWYIQWQIGESGLRFGNYKISVVGINELFDEIYNKEGEFVVKFDCEGCEYSVLCLSDSRLRYATEYYIEIHGSATPIVNKFIKNDYKMKRVDKRNEWWLGIYRFYKE